MLSIYLSVCLCLSVYPIHLFIFIIIYLLSVYPSNTSTFLFLQLAGQLAWNLLLLINVHQFTVYIQAAIASGW